MNCNKKLADYLLTHGISQTFLANKTGISIKIINSMVNNGRKISADEIGAIAKALNVSPVIFLD